MPITSPPSFVMESRFHLLTMTSITAARNSKCRKQKPDLTNHHSLLQR
ncbi:hypothetical protein TorRG33x02_282420 [Trema orientale]|uniref:Uncharacterized protein n=1 Tax=Trema orientale TaxID=63057 RepID=A0A2P5CJK8_TREOI|nr:hypothetical protein TorRG33x02_282420 [Trema orientale]